MAEDSFVLKRLRRASVCREDPGELTEYNKTQPPPRCGTRWPPRVELFHLFLSVGAFLPLLFSQLFVLLAALQILCHSIIGWHFIHWREKRPHLHIIYVTQPLI